MIIPESLGLCFAFWDRQAQVKNDWVFNRCRDLSRFYLNSCFYSIPTLEHSDIDVLLRTAAQTQARYCLVQSYGHLVLRFDFYQELERYLESLKSSPFLVMGHILDRKENYFELHHQCFVVNLDLYRKLGAPCFGLEEKGKRSLIQPQRSAENFHDDYTPPWVGPPVDPRRMQYSGSSEGWGLINASIENGLRVHNFNEQMRRFKHFLYPEAKTENFEKALKSPEKNLGIELNDGQERFLSGMRQNWNGCRSSIFVFNTDDIGNVQAINTASQPLGAVYCVASGFRSLKLLEMNGFNKETEVIYFDYSQAALDFRKVLVEKFDGDNFVDFLMKSSDEYEVGSYQARPKSAPRIEMGDGKFAEQFPKHPDYDRISFLWKKTQDAFGGPESFKKIWDATRTLPHQYLLADLFDTPSSVSNCIQKDQREPILVWWSNSFATEATHTFMDLKKIDKAFDNFNFVLKNRAGKTFVDGMSSRQQLLLGDVHA